MLTTANYLHFHQRERELKAAATERDWNFKLGINCNAVDLLLSTNCRPNSLNIHWRLWKCRHPPPSPCKQFGTPVATETGGQPRIMLRSDFQFHCSAEASPTVHNAVRSFLKDSAIVSHLQGHKNKEIDNAKILFSFKASAAPISTLEIESYGLKMSLKLYPEQTHITPAVLYHREGRMILSCSLHEDL